MLVNIYWLVIATQSKTIIEIEQSSTGVQFRENVKFK